MNFFKNFVDFHKLSYKLQIDIISYYLIVVCNSSYFTSKEIKTIFEELNLHPYSNIPAYLSQNSSGKNSKYIKNSSQYRVSTHLILNVEELLQIKPDKPVSNQLIDLSLFDGTRDYLYHSFYEAQRCYDEKLYTSSLIMIRKAIEILIIDYYEKYNNQHMITGKDGNYFYLSELINVIKKDTSANLNRNAIKAFDHFKKFGDMSAHGKFKGIKSDLDLLKDDLRITIDQMLILINYKDWK